MENCTIVTWLARRRNEEAGDCSVEIKHSGKACICETFDLGKPNLDDGVVGECFYCL